MAELAIGQVIFGSVNRSGAYMEGAQREKIIQNASLFTLLFFRRLDALYKVKANKPILAS